MSRRRHGAVRALVTPEAAAGKKLCTDCKHCEDGWGCVRNLVVTPGRVMIDLVDGSKHTFEGKKKGWLSCAREREEPQGRTFAASLNPFIVHQEIIKCGPEARFFEAKPEPAINVEEFMKP